MGEAFDSKDKEDGCYKVGQLDENRIQRLVTCSLCSGNGGLNFLIS